MKALSTILDFIFPAKCAACGKTGSDLCLGCLSTCGTAERESPPWIFPLYDYRHPIIKKAIHLLKYKRRRPLARVFALALYDRILEELADVSVMENFQNSILIPIPLSPSRKKERGFNQAELICRELLKIDEKNKMLSLETEVLWKPKDTVHQAHIENRSKRLQNIIGSFAIKNPERIEKRNIILLDDVITTGATLSEAKKMLKNSGARKIIAFTVAH